MSINCTGLILLYILCLSHKHAKTFPSSSFIVFAFYVLCLFLAPDAGPQHKKQYQKNTNKTTTNQVKRTEFGCDEACEGAEIHGAHFQSRSRALNLYVFVHSKRLDDRFTTWVNVTETTSGNNKNTTMAHGCPWP